MFLKRLMFFTIISMEKLNRKHILLFLCWVNPVTTRSKILLPVKVFWILSFSLSLKVECSGCNGVNKNAADRGVGGGDRACLFVGRFDATASAATFDVVLRWDEKPTSVPPKRQSW